MNYEHYYIHVYNKEADKERNRLKSNRRFHVEVEGAASKHAGRLSECIRNFCTYIYNSIRKDKCDNNNIAYTIYIYIIYIMYNIYSQKQIVSLKAR